jgi:hypothetical protein
MRTTLTAVTGINTAFVFIATLGFSNYVIPITELAAVFTGV